MLVNGKEVFGDTVNLSQAYVIQNQINKLDVVDDELKTDRNVVIKNGDIETEERPISPNASNWSISSYGGFEQYGSTTKKRTTLTRPQLYEQYLKMDTNEFLHRGLEIIADEASQKNESDEIITIESDNEKVKKALEDLFIENLGFDTELWSIIFETCKMGDNFYEVVLELGNGKAYGIKRLKYLDPSKIEIKEKDGKIDYYIYRYSEESETAQTAREEKLFPWQIIHFKIESKVDKPYGRSLLFSGIRTYNRLVNTEDIFLTYVISRTPTRRVFKIDTGNKPFFEAQREIQEIRDRYRSQQVIDENGNINRTASMMSITSDIFVPVREGSTGTQIELLNGDNMSLGQNMTFVDYFKNNLLRILNIPPEYLGENSQGADKSTSLSQRDIKFGRFIERIQNNIIKSLYKLATLQLFFLGFEEEEMKNFTISLTPPSTIKEVSDFDLINQKITLISSMNALGIFPTTYMLKYILKLSDKEINDIKFMKMIEDKNNALNQAGQQEMGGGAIGAPMIGGAPMAGGAPMDMGAVPNVSDQQLSGGIEPPTGTEGELSPEGQPLSGDALSGGIEPPTGTEESFNFLNSNDLNLILEDKEDWKIFIKYLKEQEKVKKKKQKNSEFISNIGAILEDNRKEKVSKNSNMYSFLETNNEFKGLEVSKNKGKRAYKIYENNSKKRKEIRNTLNG